MTLDDDAEFQCQVPIARLQSRMAYLNVWVPPEEPRIPDGPIVQVNILTLIVLQIKKNLLLLTKIYHIVTNFFIRQYLIPGERKCRNFTQM